MSGYRTKTLPEVKWLANELAATAGALQRLDEHIERLQTERARLLSLHSSLSTTACIMTVAELPDVVLPVHGHHQFGARGRLRDWIRLSLQAVYPAGIDTLRLADAAQDAFGLVFASPKERKRFIDNSLRNALKRMRTRGEVEPLHALESPTPLPGVWRWRMNEPSMAELRAQAEEV